MDGPGKHCPNCSAPLDLPLGETELVCDYCESRLHFVPGEAELSVVKTREEMKYKERVAVRQMVMRRELEREEAEAWRRTAAQVAISAAPAVGSAVARVAFRAALGRSAGCFGCGILFLMLLSLAAITLLAV